MNVSNHVVRVLGGRQTLEQVSWFEPIIHLNRQLWWNICHWYYYHPMEDRRL